MCRNGWNCNDSNRAAREEKLAEEFPEAYATANTALEELSKVINAETMFLRASALCCYLRIDSLIAKKKNIV